MSAGQPAPSRMTRRGVVVLGIVVLALLAFGSTTQTWLFVRLPQEAVQTPDLEVAGSDAAVPVTAFALVALAAALAVSIAGRVARWIIAVLLVLAGTGIALTSAGVALDPRNAAEPAIGTAIGVSGSAGAEATATALPWVAAVAGVLLVLAAAWVVLAGRSWGINKRYDAGAARVPRPAGAGLLPSDSAAAPAASVGDVPPGVRSDADQHADHHAKGSTGTDRSTGAAAAAPTSGDMPRQAPEGQAAAGGTPDPGAAGESVAPKGPRRSSHTDEIDSWDELSRGNDPTG